jgi:thiamine pyrophosphokinase
VSVVHALIFLWQPDGSPVHGLPAHDLAVAADSGLDTAARWGVHVDVAVGDFDSAVPTTVQRAEVNGTEVQRVPAEKDATDGELAIAVALERGATELTFVMSSLGRPDHALTALLGLGSPALSALRVQAWIDATRAEVVRSSVSLSAKHGRLVSLIPLFGDVTGVTTSALAYPLHDATLHAGSGRPVSNEFASDAVAASVSVASGVLLVMQSALFR